MSKMHIKISLMKKLTRPTIIIQKMFLSEELIYLLQRKADEMKAAE